MDALTLRRLCTLRAAVRRLLAHHRPGPGGGALPPARPPADAPGVVVIRHHVRVWLTSPQAPAAGGLAALVVAAALLGTWLTTERAIPAFNAGAVMLLPLALGGSHITSLTLPPRPRPARLRRAGHQTPVPGRATHTVRVGGARCGQGMPRPGQRPAQPMRASSPGRDSSQPVDSRLGGRPAAATGEAAAAGPTSPPGARPTRTPMAGRAPGSQHPINENARRLQPAGGKGSSR